MKGLEMKAPMQHGWSTEIATPSAWRLAVVRHQFASRGLRHVRHERHARGAGDPDRCEAMPISRPDMTQRVAA
jgi:hypothetical protein